MTRTTNRHKKNGLSTEKCFEMFAKAELGVYKPKTFSDDEIDVGILMLRMGSSRLSFAMNNSNIHGMPSESTIRRRALLPNFVAMHGKNDPVVIADIVKILLFLMGRRKIMKSVYGQ